MSPSISTFTRRVFSLLENSCCSETVKCINPLQQQNWDGLLCGNSCHSFFHTSAWARVLVSAYNYKPAYFTEDKSGILESLLPCMEVDSWLTGRRGIALPFTDHCEPFSSDASSFVELFQSACEFGRQRGWRYFECRGGREKLGTIPVSLSFYGHILNLTSNLDAMFASMESSVRRAIRKAEKSKLTVAISQSMEAMRSFYDLQCKTRKKHGLPPQPFAFFKRIHEHVLSQNMGNIVMASYEGRPIAASVYFSFGNRAIYKYGASDEAFQHLRGTNLVMWEAIKWYASNGMKTLNFGRTSLSNDGLRRFKLGWGADEHKIEYVKYNLRKKQFVMDADASSGWHNRIFRVMPEILARMTGRMIYRHMA